MSIIFVKLFLLGRFKAGDFASGGIGVCYRSVKTFEYRQLLKICFLLRL